MAEDAPKAAARIPEEILDHCRTYLDSVEQLGNIVRLSEVGISKLRYMPKAVKALALTAKEGERAKYEENLALVQAEADLAEKEVSSGFAVLHGFGAVSLWSWLESFVKGVVALWLTHHRDAFLAPAFQRLRVHLGRYMQLEPADQAEYVVDLLDGDIAGSLRHGVNRFECLLEPLGLAGEVPREHQRTLFELHQVRNVLAHRDGIVDRAFTAACPWVEAEVGKRFAIDGPRFGRYAGAATEYYLAVLCRIGAAHGQDLSKARANEGFEAEGETR